MSVQSKRLTISIPDGLYKFLDAKALQIGITMPTLVRMILLKSPEYDKFVQKRITPPEQSQPSSDEAYSPCLLYTSDAADD